MCKSLVPVLLWLMVGLVFPLVDVMLCCADGGCRSPGALSRAGCSGRRQQATGKASLIIRSTDDVELKQFPGAECANIVSVLFYGP